jgi:MFS family permease
MASANQSVAPGEAAAAPASPWSAFRHPTFRVVWIATVVSNVGGWVSSAASGWLMTSLNPDPLAVSLVQVMSNLPLFALALPAGALADVMDQRRLLIAAELAIMASTTVFAILVSTHLITPTSLLTMTALTSAAGALSLPAWQTVVSQLVSKPELPAAVALNSLGINISRAVGPALGGFLVSTFGFGPPFWVDAFSNAGVIGALLRWRRPPQRGASLPRERIGRALRVVASRPLQPASASDADTHRDILRERKRLLGSATLGNVATDFGRRDTLRRPP